ncbi:hypothetical protein [Ensifer adhaerens]|uniref:hypothetical protein n=1 Tax=Ensifer adhaerens TaxID=106592 RepID=UPI000CF1B154|nr:hypothetical protein [Ensifer adhaerens]
MSRGENVKPLAWSPESTDEAGYSSTIAKTPFGFQYDVWRIKEGALWNGVGLPKVDGEAPKFDSRETAISAVNKDYADRVLELVDLSPQWEWLHKHSFTGADMWLDTEMWMGRKSEIRRDKEQERLKVDASNQADDAETVRRERGELATELCRLLDEVSYLTAALSECEAYFDPRADSEYFHGSRIPNEEMKLLTSIRETLKKVSEPRILATKTDAYLIYAAPDLLNTGSERK